MFKKNIYISSLSSTVAMVYELITIAKWTNENDTAQYILYMLYDT
jgi:DMSO reductase anchor subunit